MTVQLSEINRLLNIGDAVDKFPLERCGEWMGFAIETGFYLSTFSNPSERVVCCISSPEVSLLNLMIGFGALLAATEANNDSNKLKFSDFLELDSATTLYWFENGKQRKGTAGDIHDLEGGGRKVEYVGGGSTLVFRSNFNRFNFQFSQSQARSVQHDSEAVEFYRALGVDGQSVLSAMDPVVVAHGKKGKTIEVANSVYLELAGNAISLKSLLNLSDTDNIGRGSFRLLSDLSGAEQNRCRLATFSSARRFDRLVRRYGHSNLLFLFEHQEFTDHALSRMSELTGRSAPDFPTPPKSIRCQSFLMKRHLNE
jgi:hypothetical protein